MAQLYLCIDILSERRELNSLLLVPHTSVLPMNYSPMFTLHILSVEVLQFEGYGKKARAEADTIQIRHQKRYCFVFIFFAHVFGRNIDNGQFYPPNSSIFKIKYGISPIFRLDGVCLPLHLFFCRFNADKIKMEAGQPQSFFRQLIIDGIFGGFD